MEDLLSRLCKRAGLCGGEEWLRCCRSEVGTDPAMSACPIPAEEEAVLPAAEASREGTSGAPAQQEEAGIGDVDIAMLEEQPAADGSAGRGGPPKRRRRSRRAYTLSGSRRRVFDVPAAPLRTSAQPDRRTPLPEKAASSGVAAGSARKPAPDVMPSRTSEGHQKSEERLGTAHTEMRLLQDNLRQVEIERQAAGERALKLEHSLRVSEDEKRDTQERLCRARNDEGRHELESKSLREVLEASENRGTDLELRRRSLEGELERTRLCLAEREAEVQSLQDRAHSLHDHLKESEDREAALQREVQRLSLALSRAQDGERHLQEKSQGLSQALGEAAAGRGNLQDDVTRLQGALTAAEQDRRVLQERLDSVRQALSDSKRQNLRLSQTVQEHQQQLGELQLACREYQARSEELQQALLKHQHREKEQGVALVDLQERLKALHGDKTQVEIDKQDIQHSATLLEKGNNTLRAALEKVKREQLRLEAETQRLNMEKEQLNQLAISLKKDLTEAQRQNQYSETQMTELERAHSQRLMELSMRHRQELDTESERLRIAQQQAESSLESRERAHRQRVRGLEEQVTTIQDQLDLEVKRRQQTLRSAH